MTTPAERVEWLRAEVARHNEAYFVHDAPEVPDADYDALVRELRDLERDHPELAAAASVSNTVGAPASATFSPVRHGTPMLSLDNVFTADELADWGRRVARGLGDGRGHHLRRRAQDRRPGAVDRLRRRRPGPGRDARRRPGGRGRHGQRAHDRQRAPAPSRSGPRPRRGARRGVSRPRRLRRDERAPARGPREGVRQPPQRRRGQPAPEGPLGHGPAPAVLPRLPARGPRGSPDLRDPRRHPRRAALLGILRRPRGPGRARCRRGRRALRVVPGSPPRPLLRHRRRRDQGRRPGRARGARLHLARAALGRRAQVPARGAHDASARDRGLDRSHRARHPLRGPRAGRRRGFDGVHGDAAQRGPGPPEGRAPRRPGHRAQGRRRHPRGRRRGETRPAGGASRRGSSPRRARYAARSCAASASRATPTA